MTNGSHIRQTMYGSVWIGVSRFDAYNKYVADKLVHPDRYLEAIRILASMASLIDMPTQDEIGIGSYLHTIALL